ncbi:YcaO-like family protein [Streptomyces sp. NPDC056549]|uniref:YcaO-like family protein n=1 Tax=Streptomyces sp. NPDC056549 TaxID=3345864 RepID=UPI003685AF08
MPDLDRLLDEVRPYVEHTLLGRSPNALHLATVRVQITAASSVRGSVRGTVDAAGIGIDEMTARVRCCSELMERLVGSSPKVLADQCQDRPEPGSVVVPWQHLTPHGPGLLAELEEGLDQQRMRWCRGTGLSSGRTYAVPASKVFPAWSVFIDGAGDDGECDASGLAAGDLNDMDRCRQHALCEVLERDASILAWRLPSWSVAKIHEEHVGDLIAGFARDNGLHLAFYDIGDVHIAPVVLCLVSDPAGRLACGTACAVSTEAAAQRASLEAVSLWNGLCKQPAGTLPPLGVRSSLDHVRWASANADTVLAWFQALPTRGPSDTVGGLEELVERCRQRFWGAEPVVIDLAVPSDRAAGAQPTGYACRVIQPYAMRKEWAADRPFTGGPRINALGSDPSRFNLLPHPFG